MPKPSELLSLTAEVEAALASRSPIVALESTIISHGLPYPQNIEMAKRVDDLIRNSGAVPATIAVADRKILVGLDDARLEQLAEAKNVAKMSQRDMPAFLMSGAFGATTVASTMVAANLAGIRVFATGGIGGVHRGFNETLDISPDLNALARINTVVVTAGAKAILDLPRTLEYLETNCVPVLGFQTDTFPAFYTRETDLDVTMRCDSAEDVSDFVLRHDALGFLSGVVVANPVPEPYALPAPDVEAAIAEAIAEAKSSGIVGKQITPFLLAQMARLTNGRSVLANAALAEHNARVGAQIAVALNRRQHSAL